MKKLRRREKKVPRNYRITQLADFIIKRAAREINSSEAEFIEMCVLDNNFIGIPLEWVLEVVI